jgi:hypothetical protein
MSRTPKPVRRQIAAEPAGPGARGDALDADDMIAAIEAPVSTYPLRVGGRAVPDRSREPRIGAACADTDVVAPPTRVSPTTNAGPSVGAVGCDVPAKQAAYDAARLADRP